jgi:hypothetical protein
MNCPYKRGIGSYLTDRREVPRSNASSIVGRDAPSEVTIAYPTIPTLRRSWEVG